MSIKFKLMLIIDSMVLLAVLMFGFILYTSGKTILQQHALMARESVLQSLANVTEESLLSEDDALLVSYTADLKRIVGELEVAYVLDGRKILAHTDKNLAPHPLPLSYSGRRIRTSAAELMVKGDLPQEASKGVSFSRKRIVVNSHPYEVVVGFSDSKVKGNIQAGLKAGMLNIFKAGLLAVLVATLLAMWLTSRLIKPFRRILSAFAITGKGNLDYKLTDTGRSDELGALSREFNGMVDKLKELDQLKKDFVSSVTHELKSPIGAIESYLDLMSYEISRSAGDPASLAAKLPRFKENISFIKQNTHRLLGFIADLLDAAKIEKGKFEISRRPSRLEPVLQDTVKLFFERARASGIELRADFGDKLPPVNVDTERICQVLFNLVSNALKFTPKGGKVTITAVASAAPDPAAGGRVLRVSVEDTGIGLSREDLSKVFEKFYQVPGGRAQAAGPKGTGLGLYIVKSIIEAHGGRTFAESTGKGSKFSFELPV